MRCSRLLPLGGSLSFGAIWVLYVIRMVALHGAIYNGSCGQKIAKDTGTPAPISEDLPLCPTLPGYWGRDRWLNS